MTTPHLVIPTDAMSVAALADALAAVVAAWPDAQLAGGGIVIELPSLTSAKIEPGPAPKVERQRVAAGSGTTNGLVLAALAEHGPIVSDTGIAVRLLCDHVPRSIAAVNKALSALADNGDVIVDRNVAAKRTYAISLPGQALPPRSTPNPSRGIVDHVRTEGLRDKLAARAEAAVE